MARKAKKQTGNTPAAVDKRAKFLELAPKRMTKALKAIGLIRNLSRYEFTPEEAEQMQKALHGEVSRVMQSFTASPGKKDVGFSFEQ
jgi:hypothetical protein